MRVQSKKKKKKDSMYFQPNLGLGILFSDVSFYLYGRVWLSRN